MAPRVHQTAVRQSRRRPAGTAIARLRRTFMVPPYTVGYGGFKVRAKRGLDHMKTGRIVAHAAAKSLRMRACAGWFWFHNMKLMCGDVIQRYISRYIGPQEIPWHRHQMFRFIAILKSRLKMELT